MSGEVAARLNMLLPTPNIVLPPPGGRHQRSLTTLDVATAVVAVADTTAW